MLTYVINTSENKTFDSSKLFELAGYSKIRWIQCSLRDIEKCVEQIYEKQNVITADDFRIAVIVDFYGFDRIRIPYGRNGYIKDDGVDLSLYMPYIEVYLLDNLIVKLENKEIFAADFEIYYVQNEKSERYELFKNASSQIRQILSGTEGKSVLVEPASVNDDEDAPLTTKTEEERTLYSSYTLYCTPNLSLEFQLQDYPYGALEMNFEDFWDAFRDRVAIKANLRRHYYITPYGGGASRAALHTLSLSLYLIHMYEREGSFDGEGDMDVEQLDSRTLCDVLEKAWVRINAAKEMARRNNMEYYALSSNSIVNVKVDDEEEEEAEIAIARELAALPKEITDTNMSAEKMYDEIEAFFSRDAGDLKNRNRAEFDAIMSEYLQQRDETREADIEAEFLALKQGGFLNTTPQCPSKEQYNYVVQEKQQQVSALFEKVLAAEYIAVDYTEEKKRADEAFLEYKKAKAWLHRNIIGDILVLLLVVASMVVPYYVLQLKTATSMVASIILGLYTAGFFAALFALAMVLQMLPLMRKLNKTKTKLYNCYLACCAKERYSFSAIKRRYEKDLLSIEHTRYEIRQIKHLFDENLAKEKNVLMHRKMLDEVEDCLSSMLNHLNVEPVFDPDESIDGEFNTNKSLYSRENKVYQIFSIETIEKMFQQKGRDEK